MDWRSRTILKPSRAICRHNFRPLKGSHGKATVTICVLCVCEKIDDFLESEMKTVTNSSQVTSSISEIIHNIRFINTSLDNLHEIDGGMSELTIKPIIDTLTGLLKLSNNEIGLMIAQGVQKICPKISSEIREYIMKKIVMQMKEVATLTIGVLECLRAALQTEECLSIFLENFGQDVLPKVFQTLQQSTTTANTMMVGAASQGRRGSLAQQEINSQQSQSLFESMTIGVGTGGLEEDKQQMTLVIYSILERTLEVAKKDSVGSMEIDEENFGVAAGGRIEVFSVYLPHIHDIISNSLSLLNLKESPQCKFLMKVLGFLTKLFKHETALSLLIKSNSSFALCSALKRMLFCHTSIIQKQSISVLTNMLLTYEAALEIPGQHLRHIIELPGVVEHVDLIHAISQTMATSDPELFSMILNLLDILHGIPLFKGKLTIIVESGLRIASMVIKSDYPAIKNAHNFFLRVLQDLESVPLTLQQQIVSLYGKLPAQWEPLQRLQWAKLLLFCKSSSFQYTLVDYHEKALESLKQNSNSVACLKLLLTLSQATSNCLISSESVTYVNGESLLMALMKINCIPAIMVLAKCGQMVESVYIKTLLQLLTFYPTDSLVPRLEFEFTKTVDSATLLETFTVNYENELDMSLSVITSHEITLSVKSFFNKCNHWSAGTYMKILCWIRCNMELMKDKTLFDLWNYSVAKIVVDRFPIYLSSLSTIWIPLSHENQEERIGFVAHIYEQLDLDMCKWKESIGKPFLLEIDIGQEQKLKTEAVLVSYYFFCLYTMDDSEEYFCVTFQKNITSLLSHLLSSHPQISPSLWKCLSVYFKTSLLIVCCQTLEPSVDLVEVFETLVCSVFNAEESFANFEEILTFCGKEFSTLICWHLLPVEEVVQLLDLWSQNDAQQFQNFFSTIEPTSDEHEFALRNHMVGLTAFGSKDASDFIIQVIKERRIKWTDDIEWTNLLKILIDLKSSILLGGSQSLQIDSKLSNFSNLLELSIANRSLFSSTNLQRIQSEFFVGIITILIRYNKVESISVRCLHFILKCLNCPETRHIQTVCLDNSFLQFLQARLNTRNIRKITHFEESMFAFEIMGSLVDVVDGEYFLQKIKNVQPVSWSIAIFIVNIQYASMDVSYLNLLIALLKKDFNSKLVQVVEKDPLVLTDLLLTIMFQTQSLMHKGFLRKNEDKIWEFLYELLCFSERKVLTAFSHIDIGLEPWTLLLMSTHVISEPSPLALSKECLRFVLKWTQIARKCAVISDFGYEAFSFGSIIRLVSEKFKATIQKEHVFKKPIENCRSAEHRIGGEIINAEDKEKLELLQKIVYKCSRILDTTIDWEMEAEKSDDDDTNDEANVLGIENALHSTQKSCGSSTCSESDLNLSTN